MMRTLLLFTLALLTTAGFSQQVKVKKGEILVDGTAVGKLVKSGSIFKGRSYSLNTLTDSVVLTASQRQIPSLLEKYDKSFIYVSLNVPAVGKAGLEMEDIPAYGLEDSFAKFFVLNKIFENGKLNRAAAEAFLKAHPDTLPPNVIKYLEKEQEYMADMATLADRAKTKEVKVSERPLVDTTLFFDESYRSEKYTLIQDEIVIGYASYLTALNTRPQMPGFPAQEPIKKLVFFNVNKTPVARLDLSELGNMRLYGLDKKLSPDEHGFNVKQYAGSREKAIDIAKFLISKDVL